jgi:hypothetical protein
VTAQGTSATFVWKVAGFWVINAAFTPPGALGGTSRRGPLGWPPARGPNDGRVMPPAGHRRPRSAHTWAATCGPYWATSRPEQAPGGAAGRPGSPAAAELAPGRSSALLRSPGGAPDKPWRDDGRPRGQARAPRPSPGPVGADRGHRGPPPGLCLWADRMSRSAPLRHPPPPRAARHPEDRQACGVA